eukprot:269453-Chlamydomonas_euryale.AAC.1
MAAVALGVLATVFVAEIVWHGGSGGGSVAVWQAAVMIALMTMATARTAPIMVASTMMARTVGASIIGGSCEPRCEVRLHSRMCNRTHKGVWRFPTAAAVPMSNPRGACHAASAPCEFSPRVRRPPTYAARCQAVDALPHSLRAAR